MEETDDLQLETLFMIPVEFFAKSLDEGSAPRRMIKGVMSTDKVDHDGETVDQGDSLDCTYLMKSGYLNYDHKGVCCKCGTVYTPNHRLPGCPSCRSTGRMPLIVGYPTDIDKQPHKTILEGELLQGDPNASHQMRLAEELWQLGSALQKSGPGRRLAYSVEGPPPVRRGKRVVKAAVWHCAVTHKPVNDDSSVEMFMKSLCCGKCSPDHPQYNPAHQCSNKHHEFEDGLPHLVFALEKALESTNSGSFSTPRTSPLMRENLDRGLTTAIYGDEPCNHFHGETGRFHKGIAGCYDHMTGCLGYDSHDSHRLLSRIVKGAQRKEDNDLMALCKAAGFIP